MNLSLKDAARLLGKTQRQIRYAINQGRIPARKVDGRWVLSRDELPLSDGRFADDPASLRRWARAIGEWLGQQWAAALSPAPGPSPDPLDGNLPGLSSRPSGDRP